MKGNTGHESIIGISSISQFGAVPPILINKCMFNQAQVERKGLQIGLQSDLRLVPACRGHVFRGGYWVCDDSVFPLPL